MRNLISAIQFITILPAGKTGPFVPERMIPFFPVVGLLLGVMLAVFDLLVSAFWTPPVAAVLDVVFLAWVTGAFHLDGLGDASDGLYGHHTRERALEIMKDSRVGAMGLVAVVFALAVKWGGLSGLNEHRFLLLLIIPAFARGSMLFGFRFLPYGRPDGGTGHAFFEKPLQWGDFLWLSIPALLSLFAGWRGLLVLISFVFINAAILFYYKKRIGCITGDMLGAMVEITEPVLFLMASAGGTA